VNARFFADTSLQPGQSLDLPDQAARHVQVLRMQPGGVITLFNGQGDGSTGSEGEYTATIERMGRSDVQVTLGAYTATRRETARAVHLAVGMPANERMDWLVEKATELGVASLQPLMAERSVLKLSPERAGKKLTHWRGVAIAACEQCGRNRVPVIHQPAALGHWLKSAAGSGHRRMLLSLRAGGQPLSDAAAKGNDISSFLFLSGPEGGLGPAEEEAAIAAGFAPVTLGPRVLRAETAPLACLALLALQPA
jgi:16S rRNA (uracil1498-N3)-methyltransferase